MPGEWRSRTMPRRGPGCISCSTALLSARELLRNHLARIRMTGTAPPLSQVLSAAEPQAPQRLIEHLQRSRPVRRRTQMYSGTTERTACSFVLRHSRFLQLPSSLLDALKAQLAEQLPQRFIGCGTALRRA